jgi:predicted PurR-regulated permease PerM
MLIWLVTPLIVAQFELLARQIPEYADRFRSWISARAPNLANRIPTNAAQVLDRFGGAVGGVVGYAWNIVDIFTSLIVILLGTIYILSNPEPLAKGLLTMFPHSKQDHVVTIVTRVGTQLRGWALATAGGMFIIFLLTWLGLTIIGVQPAFLFAMIAGLLEVVPIIGPILSALPPAFAALVTEPIKALYVIIAFTIIQQVESNIIVPLLQGSTLKLHPLSIMFVVLIMAGLFGIVGVFLAIPTAAVIKVLYEELYLKRTDKNHEEIQKKADQIIRKPEEQ